MDEIVAKLAAKYKFDLKEALAFLKLETEPENDKIAVCKKNIDLWQKKLDEGKVKDEDKQREKIEKEKKKLEKLQSKVVVKEEVPKEKRIKRFSPVMTTQLKKALEDAGSELNDKIKKEFQLYVENLSDDDYRESSLADHMRTFAKTKDVPDKVVDVTLKELQQIEMTSSGETPDTFWDADKGRFVKGPEPEDDEDFDEVTFESKKYVVGVKTGRVYEAHDSGDVFAGFKGVGKFKKLKC